MVKAKTKIKKNKKSKKVKKIKKSELNPNEQLFCQLYFNSGEFFGNGVWSYIKAYNYNVPFVPLSKLKTKERRLYEVARSGAYENLTKPHIVKEGDRLLKETFNEVAVDKELNKVIAQDKDKVSKVMAIKEFNQLKNRIQKKIDLTSDGKQIQPIIKIFEYVEPKDKN